MRKHSFLQVAVAGAAAGMGPAAAAQRGPKAASGPVLLTVSGMIGPGNRGPLDPALDQLMVKQKIDFKSAHSFDFAALEALPAASIKPTLEYDSKPHALAGPLLMDVMKACGVKAGARTALLVRAIDGYAVQIAASEAAARGFIVATHLDGRPIPLGGLGPLWTVYDADRFADMAAKSVTERFALCPWATYHIEVKEV